MGVLLNIAEEAGQCLCKATVICLCKVMAAEEIHEDWKKVNTTSAITIDKKGLARADPEVGLDDLCGLLPAQNILILGDSKSQIALRPHVQTMQTLKCVVLI